MVKRVMTSFKCSPLAPTKTNSFSLLKETMRTNNDNNKTLSSFYISNKNMAKTSEQIVSFKKIDS